MILLASVLTGRAAGRALKSDFPALISHYKLSKDDPEICHVVLHGGLDKLKAELAKSPELNVRAAEGVTPLIMTLFDNASVQLEKTRLLLQAGADPNFPDSAGNTPLYYALLRNHQERAQLLLAHGARIEHLTAAGHSALQIAGECWIDDLIFPLLDKGADYKEEFRSGALIHYAAIHRNRVLVERLLQQGESIDRPFSVDGTTPLMAAVRWGDDAAVRALLEFHPQIDLQDNAGWTALMYAIALDKQTVVQILLEQKPDLKLAAKDGVNAFVLAGRRGFSDLQERAVASGAKPEKVRLPELLDKWVLLNPSQRLALTMAAYELYLGGEPIDSLKGDGEVARSRVRTLLAVIYHLHTSGEMDGKISFYFDKGERAEQINNPELAKMSESEFRAKLLTLLDDPVKINALRAARKQTLLGSENGLLAWDLCHHNALVILCVRAGWLTEEEAWAKLTASSDLFREKCQGWDVAAQILRSKLVSSFNDPKRAELMLQLFMNKVDTNSPWALVPLTAAKN